jgi:hypothetical protein
MKVPIRISWPRAAHSRRGIACLALAMVGAALLAVSRVVGAQELAPELWGTSYSGNVTGITRAGNTIYVSGAFREVGPNTGGGIPVDRRTGVASLPFPRVAGNVGCAVPDGLGGWIIGGSFGAVGGLKQARLARILGDGSVAEWGPQPDGEVRVLVLHGSRLFVGGDFTRIGGLSRNRLAVVDIATGQVSPWNPNADGRVYTLLLGDSTAYVGGDFGTVGGEVRRSLAELSLLDGRATAWNPDIGLGLTPGSVRVVARVDSTLFVGGAFSTVGTAYRRNLAAVEIRTGVATAWQAHVTGYPDNRYDPDPYVSVLVPAGGRLYAAGHFAFIAGEPRGALAELDVATGIPTPWDPQQGPRLESYSPYVTAFALTDSSAFIAGSFQMIGGRERYYTAEVRRSDGSATDWDPRPNGAPDALATDGDRVYLGGHFTSAGGWQTRINLAAFDATTGELKPWNPNPNGLIVYDVVAVGDRVYAGGHFSMIGGQVRWGLAALDTITGAAFEWDYPVNEPVTRLRLGGNRLYAGGYFTTVGDIERRHIASFDLWTGEVTDWNPGTSTEVSDVAVDGDTVFIAGPFWSVGGVPRRYLAAVDTVLGGVLDWAPQLDTWVNAIDVHDGRVYAAGAFRTVGGKPRRVLAAIDSETGEVLDWTADAYLSSDNLLRAFSIAAVGDTVYAGGNFTSVNGVPRGGLAALDARTGAVLDWDPGMGGAQGFPDMGGVIWELTPFERTLYVGGRFHWSGTTPVTGIAAFSKSVPADTTPPIGTKLSIASIAPNPAGRSAVVRFALPAAGPVTLAAYDVQGRRVASPMNEEPKGPGVHQVAIETTGWREGFYFLRLEAAGAVATGKLVVIH